MDKKYEVMFAKSSMGQKVNLLKKNLQNSTCITMHEVATTVIRSVYCSTYSYLQYGVQ